MVEMSTVWDRTSAFVASAIAAVLPIAAVLLFVPIAVQLAITPLLATQSAPVHFVVMVVFWAIELLGTLSLIVLALGAELRAGAAIHAALPRLGPAIAIFILFFIIVLIALTPLVVALAGSGIDVAALQTGKVVGHMPVGIALFMLCYVLVLVILGFWITARLIVIEPVILAERRGIGAIGRAFALTRGLTWRIVGVLILYAIVATVAVLAAREVFGALFGLIASGNSTITLATILTALVTALVSAGFKTVAAVFVGKLYQAIGEAAERRADPL